MMYESRVVRIKDFAKIRETDEQLIVRIWTARRVGTVRFRQPTDPR